LNKEYGESNFLKLQAKRFEERIDNLMTEVKNLKHENEKLKSSLKNKLELDKFQPVTKN